MGLRSSLPSLSLLEVSSSIASSMTSMDMALICRRVVSILLQNCRPKAITGRRRNYMGLTSFRVKLQDSS